MTEMFQVIYLVSCVFLVYVRTASAFQILPPIEFSDRFSAPSSSGVKTHLYDNPSWVKSWYGKLPDNLRLGPLDPGFGVTKPLSTVQVQYAANKIMRNSERTGRKEQRIADLGCGGGYVTGELAQVPGWNLIAIDQAKETLKVAKHTLKNQKDKIKFIHANMTRLPLEAGSVDAVLLFSVLEETPSLRAVFREVSRVLRPDGIMIFSTRNRSIRAWASMLWHTEILKDSPQELQDWRLGVKPGEMKRLASEEGFNMVHEELQGVCRARLWEVRWDKWPWFMQPLDLSYVECKDDTYYLGWGYKQPPAEEDWRERESPSEASAYDDEGIESFQEVLKADLDSGEKSEL